MLKNSAKNLKEYDYGESCGFFLVAIVVTLMCQAAAGVVSVALARSGNDVTKSGDFNTAFMIVVQVINGLFIYFYTKLKRNKFNFTYITDEGSGRGLTAAAVLLPVACAAVLMAGMYLPTVWYGYFTRAIGLPADYGSLHLDTASAVVMIVIASVLLAPVMEETIYRGVLLHGLRREKSAVKAALMCALAFMIMHMNPVQVVFQFALGVTCAFIAIRSGRLVPCMIAHATANALALVIEMTPLGASLAGCVAWLTAHPAAAVFITLGLFAAAGAIIFFALKYGFKSEPEAAQTVSDAASEDGEAEGDSAAMNNMAEARKKMQKSDGTFKYWIAVGICGVLFVVNLVTGIVS